jgi:hypothetical protein
MVKHLLIPLCLCISAALRAEMIDGNAIVTSRMGSVSALNADDQSMAIDLHTVLHPSGYSWSTAPDSQLFLTLSNSVAIALDAESTVQCLEYRQRPFALDQLEPGPEPSVSRLKLELKSGRIAVASNRLSPLSELRIALPFGHVRLHKGTCLIEYNSTGISLTAFEGNLTYYYPDNDAREYLPTHKRIRISAQSAGLQQIAEASTVETLDTAEVQLFKAAKHASLRVTFLPNETSGLPPEPILSVSPEYFEQAPQRPYRFGDQN